MESFTYRGITITHIDTPYEHWQVILDERMVSHDTIEDAQIAIDRHLDRR